YGITPETMGCEVRSSMEVIEVCRAREGFTVYFDRHASTADHVLVVNRVKSHTRFCGPIESGLMKMMLIGLGKQHGANVYHRAIINYSFDQIVRSVARETIQRCHIVGGLAILENGYEETAELVGVAPSEIEQVEPELLKKVQSWAPKLPADKLALLIVDHIGKEISGAGMDTNVIGRKYNDHAAIGDERPNIHHIYVRGLTKATHGNATGIGIAELCHRRVVENMDVEATRMNCMTGAHLTAAMIPVDFPTDRDALHVGFGMAGMLTRDEVPAMWIEDTLHLEEIECSQALLPQLSALEQVEVLTPPRPLEFDSHGDLVPRF
ncbi:MAG: lactate racemase domain-containing protein, partial [Aureliella sp.]